MPMAGARLFSRSDPPWYVNQVDEMCSPMQSEFLRGHFSSDDAVRAATGLLPAKLRLIRSRAHLTLGMDSPSTVGSALLHQVIQIGSGPTDRVHRALVDRRDFIHAIQIDGIDAIKKRVVALAHLPRCFKHALMRDLRIRRRFQRSGSGHLRVPRR